MPSRKTARAAPRVHQRTPGPQEPVAAAGVFTLLADATLVEAAGAALPAVSQHLAKLRLGGLVETRKEGRRVVYSLPDGPLRRLIVEAISHADHQASGEPRPDRSGRCVPFQ
ncbi:ArsR/SmtB family transcription factor [Streptomyces sp. NPDC085466]|uniref:ArsR/SmtB family transcription factor n=1 Tax=Streptomyces sp. NPDC085466 TaxID=3365725 RepID=UPI0037D81B42